MRPRDPPAHIATTLIFEHAVDRVYGWIASSWIMDAVQPRYVAFPISFLQAFGRWMEGGRGLEGKGRLVERARISSSGQKDVEGKVWRGQVDQVEPSNSRGEGRAS